jgi:formate hydrogenlyase subunit 5
MSVNLNVKDYEAPLREAFPGRDVRKQSPWRYWLTVPPEALLDTVRALGDRLGIRHLSTIVGEDRRETFQVNYILAGEVVVTVCVPLDHAKPEVPSLAPVIEGALVYEREIHDLFGIVPVGHPSLRRQILPEDWPEGLFPLRKDVQIPRTLPDAPEEVK